MPHSQTSFVTKPAIRLNTKDRSAESVDDWSSGVSVCKTVPKKLWQRLMQADPDALPYQSPEWMSAICKSRMFSDVSRLYRTADGAEFILPLVKRTWGPSWIATASSMPNAWGIGGLIGEKPPSTALVRHVFEDLSALGYLGLQIRPNPRQQKIWAEACPNDALTIPRRAHILDLRDGFDHVWTKRFSARTRTNVRKAERKGVVIEFDGTGRLLPIFYKLFEQSLARWAHMQNEPLWLAKWRGKNRDPLSKFEDIARELGQQCRVGVAWIDGQPAASIIVLQGKNANYSRGALNPDLVKNTGANDLLHKHAIEFATVSGCNFYHMGETGKSSSLAQFKEKLGADPVEYAEYRLERLPVFALERSCRAAVKKLIGFKDTNG